MSEQFQRYAEGAAQIQRGCICRSWNPRECYRLRHHRWDDGDFDEDDDCSCRCHDELRELEHDIWGDSEGMP